MLCIRFTKTTTSTATIPSETWRVDLCRFVTLQTVLRTAPDNTRGMRETASNLFSLEDVL